MRKKNNQYTYLKLAEDVLRATKRPLTISQIWKIGENEFLFAPNPGGSFEYASMAYDSVYGYVSCSWRKNEKGGFDYSIVVPSNTIARFVAPGKDVKIFTAGTYKFNY